MQGFSLHKPVCPLYPFFFIYFMFYMHFFHALEGYFQTMHKLGILMFQAEFCEIDQWFLLIYCYIHDLCWLIWSIWGFVRACIEPKLGILFELVSIDKIGLLNWCNWSLFWVICLVWWSIGQFVTNFSVFQNFGVFVRNSMLNPILWIWT